MTAAKRSAVAPDGVRALGDQLYLWPLDQRGAPAHQRGIVGRSGAAVGRDGQTATAVRASPPVPSPDADGRRHRPGAAVENQAGRASGAVVPGGCRPSGALLNTVVLT